MTQQQKSKAAEGVGTTLNILDTLVSQSERAWGVRELAEYLGLSRTTTNRVLSQLCEEGLARQTSDSSYTVGPRLCVLSSMLFSSHPVLSRGAEVLDTIRQQVGGTVFMSVQAIDGQRCFVVQESETETPVRYRIEPGNILPTYAGAAGQAILSQLDEACWPDQVRTFTDKTLTVSEQRNDRLRQVRQQQFSVSVGQHIVGAAGIAVPFRFSPALLGSVSASRPEWEFKEEIVPKVVSVLKKELGALEAAAAIAYQKAGEENLGVQSTARRAGTQIGRVSQLLTYLVSHSAHSLTVGDIGQIVGAGNFAIASLVEAAEQCGVLCRTHDRKLSIGPTLLRWLASVDSNQSRESLALGEMRELSALTGETVGLALLSSASRETPNKSLPHGVVKAN